MDKIERREERMDRRTDGRRKEGTEREGRRECRSRRRARRPVGPEEEEKEEARWSRGGGYAVRKSLKSSFGNVKSFNLKKKLSLGPSPQWPQTALRLGGDGRRLSSLGRPKAGSEGNERETEREGGREGEKG